MSCACAISDKWVARATKLAALWLICTLVYVVSPMIKITNSGWNYYSYEWLMPLGVSVTPEYINWPETDVFFRGYFNLWTDDCDYQAGHEGHPLDASHVVSDVLGNGGGICSKALASFSVVSISFLSVFGGSICGCVQGRCATRCFSNGETCGKMSIVSICFGWLFFPVGFAILASTMNSFTADDSENYAINYHVGFYLGLFLVLFCIGAVGFGYHGCRQFRDDQRKVVDKMTVGPPSVVVCKVVGNSRA